MFGESRYKWKSGDRVAGTEIGDGLAVRESDGAPIDLSKFGPLNEMLAVGTNAPEMTAIDVVAIGIEENCFAVGGERPLFDFAISRGEKLGLAAIGG